MERPSSARLQPLGFVLVVTLSLMVLLILVALGLLSLSAISLRTATAAAAQQEARANARLALQLAIGDLQRGAGPDQRITAPGALVDPKAPRALTGAWRSHQASSKSLSVDAKAQFDRWLISHPSRTAIENGAAIPPVTGSTVELIGPGSLGPDAEPGDRLAASMIGVDRGGFAYAVLDESGKARIDLVPRPGPFGEIGKQAHLGEARRFGIEAITPLGQGGFAWWRESGQDRSISLATGQLLPGATRVKEFGNDLTVWSRGLLTDTARGGLRGDLSVMYEGTMPTPYATGRVYTDPEAATAPSNPYWRLLRDYSSAYKKVLPAAAGTYKIAANVPSGYQPYSKTITSTGTTVVPTPGAVTGYPMMPVVTKLEMVFSLFTLNAYDDWGGFTEGWYIGEDFTASSSRRTHTDDAFEQQFRSGSIFRYKGDVKRRYMLMMMYSPIVTVYNPFNLPIEFDALKVGFDDLPIGFHPFINGVPQLSKMAHFNQLYFQNESAQAKAKRFELVLRSNFSSAGTAAPLVIPPGETIVLGNSADPNKNFWQVADFYSIGDQTSATIGIDVIPGWSEGVGYVVDWLAPRTLLSPNASMWGIVALRREDKIDMEFGPLAATDGKTNLTATVDLVRGANNYPGGVIHMEYGSQQNLTKVVTDQVQGGASVSPASGPSAQHDGTLRVPGREVEELQAHAAVCHVQFPQQGDGRFGNRNAAGCEPSAEPAHHQHEVGHRKSRDPRLRDPVGALRRPAVQQRARHPDRRQEPRLRVHRSLVGEWRPCLPTLRASAAAAAVDRPVAPRPVGLLRPSPRFHLHRG